MSNPSFALNLTQGLSLHDCELYFTAINTLLQYEVKPVQEILEIQGNWIVYIAYENRRRNIRNMLLKDLNKIANKIEEYYDKENLERVLSCYFDFAKNPFNEISFIKNKEKLFDYESLENERIFNDKDFSGVEIGLVRNNSVEVRTKNPIYFVGFFSESKFFLRRDS